MARRPATPPEPQRAVLTVEQMRRGIARIQKRIGELEAFDPQSVQKRWAPEVTALETSIEEALSVAFGHNTIEYKRYEAAASLDSGAVIMRMGAPRPEQDRQEARQYLIEGKQRSLLLLRQAIRGLEEEIAERDDSLSPTRAPEPTSRDLSKVFVVHGHDGESKQTVARFIEKLGFEAVILHERPNKGRTIISKFREESADVGFAVVLMTPDDVGGVPGVALAQLGAQLRPRARQNVVFELGFFIGALGPDRVAALVKGDIERPSDFDGVVYISLDDGSWKAELARELKAAGYEIDWNRVMA